MRYALSQGKRAKEGSETEGRGRNACKKILWENRFALNWQNKKGKRGAGEEGRERMILQSGRKNRWVTDWFWGWGGGGIRGKEKKDQAGETSPSLKKCCTPGMGNLF